jgi:hypothetical protein
MTALNQSRLNKDEVLALRSLRLSCESLSALRRTGIYCQAAVSIQFQQEEQRYVIRGLESGGAVAKWGAYCGFVAERGAPFAGIKPSSAIAVNGFHVGVWSTVLVRIHLFRVGLHSELLVTHHSLHFAEGKSRPRLHNSVLFHSRNGTLPRELCGQDHRLSGTVAPVFYGRSGEQLRLPDCFHDAIIRTTAGACCIGCRHAHVADSFKADSTDETPTHREGQVP